MKCQECNTNEVWKSGITCTSCEEGVEYEKTLAREKMKALEILAEVHTDPMETMVDGVFVHQSRLISLIEKALKEEKEIVDQQFTLRMEENKENFERIEELEKENYVLKDALSELNQPCRMQEIPCGECLNCEFKRQYHKIKSRLQNVSNSVKLRE